MNKGHSYVTERETKLVTFWKDKQIFEKSVENRPVDKQYVFYDGPPFATGLPHYGHILGLTSKDLFCRYWTMKGFRVERRWGWDCHGLPIENMVERKLGLKEKKEIEAMGIAKFNETCRATVLEFAAEWKKTVNRMGKWIEFDNSYKTMDNSYMETIWWIFKKLYNDGYVYEGKKILLYCPRCQTPLAKSEIAMDKSYRNVTEKTATVKFKLKDEDASILAWTTTPWTLIGNVALAVGGQLQYVKVDYKGEKLILAKDRVQELEGEYKVLETFKGKKLVGKEYDPLYKVDSDKKGHYIIEGGDEVSAEEGTGVIHMAIYGEFDYQMIRKYDLPVIQHVGTHGKLVSGPEEWIDVWFKKADKLVIEELDNRGLLLKAESYTHSYPFCYRCDTPLFYNAVDSWFVDIQKIKPQLLERNKDINWYPHHLKEGQFHHNVSTAPDWTFSRNRYWATTIPVWKCDTDNCSEMKIIGSVKELREHAVEEVPEDVDLHKHVMDNFHFKCSTCSGQMSRIPEIFDCWFESGSMPYAVDHYPFENEKEFQQRFPADFISEYIAQTRTWFYYMHAMGVLLFDKAPFKNVVVSGNVLAADGQKMSKSKKNFPDPNLIFESYGADALRFYLMNSQLMKAEDLNFKEDGVKETYRKIVVLLSNVLKFYEMFRIDGQILENPRSGNVLDRWIISKLNLLIRNVTNALDDYNTGVACSEIQAFIDELSTWYVRRSRDRLKKGEGEDKEMAVKTLGFCLHTVAKLAAPITPFISETVHQSMLTNCRGLEESVHLEVWPGVDIKAVDEKLNAQMVEVRNIVSKALDAREKAKVPIRQALSKLELQGVKLSKDLLDLIAAEVNVKEVVARESGEFSLKLDTEITPELLLEGISRDFIRKVNNLRKKQNLTIKDRIVLYVDSDDSNVSKSLKKFHEDIAASVQADEVKLGMIENKDVQEVTISGSKVSVVVEKR